MNFKALRKLKLSLLISITFLNQTYTAENIEEKKQVNATSENFNIKIQFLSLLHSSELQKYLDTTDKRARHVICLRYLINDQDYYNPTNNALTIQNLPLFKYIFNLMDEEISWAFVRKLDLVQEKLNLNNILSKNSLSNQIKKSKNKEYREIFSKKINSLTHEQIVELRGSAIKESAIKILMVIESIKDSMSFSENVTALLFDNRSNALR